MRRPSPLPPTVRASPDASPSAGDEPAAASPGTTTATEPAPAPHPDRDPAEAVAPVIAFAVRRGSEPTSPSGPVGDPPIGLREVWRAARARRRMLRAEVRRFTVRQRRRRAVWLGAAASLVILVLATLGAAYSPLFAVESIQVEGASQLNAATVEAALAGQLGTPLPLVDESAVKATLVTFPLIESYSLEARPPHELVVRIVERTPVGVVKTAAG